MILHVKFDFNALCKKVLEEKLIEHDIKHKIVGFGEVELLEKLSPEKLKNFTNALNGYHIEIIENQKDVNQGCY